MYNIGDRVVYQARVPVIGTVTYVMSDRVRVEFDTHVQRDIEIDDARLVSLA